MLPGFTGEYLQKVDAKGRMSIPADFREVLEAGDPAALAAGKAPGVYVQYGKYLNGRLLAWTVEAFSQIAEAITSIRPTTDDDKEAQLRARREVLGQTTRLDIDKDGRVILPLRQRENLGFAEGEVVFMGLGDSFEIWPAATYQTQVVQPMAAEARDRGPNYDPMTAIWRLSGG